MKIIRTAEQVKKEKAAREKANRGCDKCPCCGGTKILHRPMHPHPLNVIPPISYMKRWLWRDEWRCLDCGAQWRGKYYWL